jgi:ABC-type sulfate/molybdate transport systems ATPase subunit
LDRVDLTGYDKRPVQALSGGQQQRVALARALAIEPPLLLLDEPLSNLDQALRFRTRMELRRLVRELGITALFVTHDQEEAFDLSDRIAVMRDGRLLQMGPPDALYLEPVDPFVAGFMGRVNSFRVVLESGGLRLPTGARWPVPSRVPPSAEGAMPSWLFARKRCGSPRRTRVRLTPPRSCRVSSPMSVSGGRKRSILSRLRRSRRRWRYSVRPMAPGSGRG